MSDGPTWRGELKRIPPLLPGDIPGDRGSTLPDSALREAKLLGKDLSPEEIQRLSAHNEHARTEKFRDHFERVAICGLWLVAAVMAIIGATWFWHIVTPQAWHWLTPDSVSKIQNIVTGGVLAAVAGGHLKKRVG